jgi:predicted Zn-dependent peptidase
MTERLDKHILQNGMVILGEPVANVASAAFDFFLPCGASLLPKGCGGAAEIISDWIFRGAGKRNSRELSDALDSLGLHRSTAVSSAHLMLGAAMEADTLPAAIDIFADIILRASLKDDQFELSRQLALQELLALDDDPRQKAMLKLQEYFYPRPLGASPLGTADELNALIPAKASDIVRQSFNPANTIFAVAGKYDFDGLCRQVEALFDVPAEKSHIAVETEPNKAHYIHEQHEGAQVHIGVMTPTARLSDKDYYDARVAVSVLSGGMSARLFTEVREKRGLCYAIGAQYHNLKDMAGIASYAGSAPEKAQETLDVVISEFNRLADGISEEEIQRAKVGLKSSLIMQSESTSARAGGIGMDYYFLGRVRPLEEIKENIDKTSVESVLTFLRSNPFKEFTVVTIGPRELAAKTERYAI